VVAGHEHVVRLLLEKGANIEARGLDQRTPLELAVKYRRENIVRLLFEKGVNIEARGYHQKTPLEIAAENGSEFVFGCYSKKALR
jgi:ankyrin repeat domain-containing protein 50